MNATGRLLGLANAPRFTLSDVPFVTLPIALFAIAPSPLLPDVSTPLNSNSTASSPMEVPFRLIVIVPAAAPEPTSARQACMRLTPAPPEYNRPPGVPISVNVRPAPATLVATGAMPPLPMAELTNTTYSRLLPAVIEGNE